MPASRRLPTLLCLSLATAAAGVGVAFVWQKYTWLTTWRDVVVVLGASAALVALTLGWRRALRAPPPPGLVLRAAILGAVGLWFGYALFAGDYRRGRVGCAALAWAGCVGLAVGSAPATPRRPSRLALLLLATAVTLLFGELSLRALSWLRPGPLWAGRTGHTEERLRVHAFAPGAEHYGFPVNAHGCYDAPFAEPGPARGPVVAVIGDSFSASVVPHAFHYTTVAEHELDAAVWNVGWAALGPAEYRYLLANVVLPLRPDAVVVALFLGNDLAETPPFAGFDRTLAGWLDRGNVRLLEVPRRLFARGGADVGLRRLGDLAAAQAWLHDPAREPGSFTADAFLALEVSRARTACDPDLPRLPALLAELEAMRALCGDVPFALLLIPDECMVEDALWQRVVAAWPEGAPPPARHVLRDRLVAWCDGAGVPCLDLLPALRAVAPWRDGDRRLYLLRDTHWNVRGNAVAGEALAPFAAGLLAAPGGR